ncbi:hypothetical protein [Odoribacter lunatus]|uniref:hypothetical protein n=1 Tax=Odoribacter lunatus TaxID=2941335 RepID=UPI0020422FDE|nr:hypothetical protein [Odoribacter lunatus]
MKNVKLKPWVGKNYRQGFQGRKIMVLGESHYADHPCGENFTSEIVADNFLNPQVERKGWMNTYTKFERAMLGRELSQEERMEFWDSIMFYNYIQEPLCGPRLKPTREQYIAAQEPFIEILEEFHPDGVIVWSERLYNALPQCGQQGDSIIVQSAEEVETWKYFLSDGHEISVLPIQHPSSGFSWDYWYPILSKFIEYC